MRAIRFAAPAAAIIAAAALAACGSNTSPSANAAATNTPGAAVASAVASDTASDSPEADACKVLAAMKFDATTMDKSSTTQDQMNAALNLLPQHDGLGADMLAMEQDLVTLDTDLAAEQLGTPNATQQYENDTPKMQGALNTVESDCALKGVPFAASLYTAQ